MSAFVRVFRSGIPNLSGGEAESSNTGGEGSELSLEGGYVPEVSLSTPQESCDVEPVVDTGLENNLGNPFPNPSLSSLNALAPAQPLTNPDNVVAVVEQTDATSADDSEEATAPAPSPDAPVPASTAGEQPDFDESENLEQQVAIDTLEVAPLPSKPSIEVAEITPSSSPQHFQKGDRVCHPEYGAGTVEYISDWMASCIFDAATDSLGHLHHNTRRSPNISELSHLQE